MPYRIKHIPTGKYFKKRGSWWGNHWEESVNDIGSIHEKIGTAQNVLNNLPHDGDWEIVEIEINDVDVVEI